MNYQKPKGHDRPIPKNLVEMAHEETGQWLKRDELETWVFRRFQRLDHQIKRLEEEHEAKVIQNVQLMRDRDAYQRVANDRAEQRDALAAHVERLKSALDNILSEVGTHSHDDLSDDERKALSALEATPATSLARRDVLKQAEALEEAAAETVPAMHKMKHWLLSRANDLRQQAEGHQ